MAKNGWFREIRKDQKGVLRLMDIFYVNGQIKNKHVVKGSEISIPEKEELKKKEIDLIPDKNKKEIDKYFAGDSKRTSVSVALNDTKDWNKGTVFYYTGSGYTGGSDGMPTSIYSYTGKDGKIHKIEEVFGLGNGVTCIKKGDTLKIPVNEKNKMIVKFSDYELSNQSTDNIYTEHTKDSIEVYDINTKKNYTATWDGNKYHNYYTVKFPGEIFDIQYEEFNKDGSLKCNRSIKVRSDDISQAKNIAQKRLSSDKNYKFKLT